MNLPEVDNDVEIFLDLELELGKDKTCESVNHPRMPHHIDGPLWYVHYFHPCVAGVTIRCESFVTILRNGITGCGICGATMWNDSHYIIIGRVE